MNGTNAIGVAAKGETTSIEVTGKVTGGQRGIDALESAEVSVEGDVTGENDSGINARDGASVEIVGDVSGETQGVVASDGATVIVIGDVSGESNGIFSGSNAVVIVSEHVDGDINADGGTVYLGELNGDRFI